MPKIRERRKSDASCITGIYGCNRKQYKKILLDRGTIVTKNKKEAVAALHREQIMKAAEKLFLEKGYAQTTIEDFISVYKAICIAMGKYQSEYHYSADHIMVSYGDRMNDREYQK